VGEERGIRSAEPVEPVSCPLGLMAHALELAACPPDDIGVDPLESGTQLRLVEMAVVGDLSIGLQNCPLIDPSVPLRDAIRI
jgi:hypothetical protein